MQSTLKSRAVVDGIGLHSGRKVSIVLHPAPADHGIVFVRSDVKGLPQIKADISCVVRTDLCTTLGDGNGVIVATVEHLMAAISGLGVDNALIEVTGPEIPIMDGSALPFAAAIADAGIKSLSVPRKVLRLKKTVTVRHQDKWIVATPSRTGLKISGSIEFKHGVIGEQSYTFGAQTDFLQDIAAARTFGFLKEVEYLHKKGLALGGSLENAIVLDEERVLNSDGLRFADEFVRHKVLDAYGDFALLGLGLQASVRTHKSGHELHAGFINKILEDPSQYEIVELASAAQTAAEEATAGFSLGMAVPA